MFWKILIYIFIICTTFSCSEYGSFGRNSGDVRGTSDTPSDLNYSSGSSCSSGSKNWGGISCQGGSDDGFKNFLTSDTIIDPSVSKRSRYKKVECQPGNNQGIIFHLSLVFSGDATVNLNGNNQNLTLDLSSMLTIRIVDQQALNIELPAVRGEISGNQANFEFADDKGSVTLEGTFDSQFFTGQVSFKNDRELVNIKEDGQREYNHPGREGVLGDFKISSCSVFPSS